MRAHLDVELHTKLPDSVFPSTRCQDSVPIKMNLEVLPDSSRGLWHRELISANKKADVLRLCTIVLSRETVSRTLVASLPLSNHWCLYHQSKHLFSSRPVIHHCHRHLIMQFAPHATLLLLGIVSAFFCSTV